MRETTRIKRPYRVRIFGAALLAVILSAATAAVSSAGPTQQELDAAKAKLRELNRTLDQLVEDFDAATVKLQQVQARLADTRTEATQAQEAAAKARAILGQRASAAYEGVGSGIDLLLGATTFADFNERLQFANSLARMDIDAATQAEVTQREAQLASARLQQSLSERKDLLDTLSSRQEQIESSIADQQSLIDELQKEITQEELQRVLSQPGPARPAGGGPTPAPTPPPPPPPDPGPGAATAVDAAYSALGVPYKWGGSNPDEGFDCSGLTMWSWAQAGVSLPHSSSAQYGAVPHVSRDALQPGDLLFFYQPISHVAMYVGNNQMIHATHPGSVVSLDTIDDYWWAEFTGAGRP
jgi:cell wall-associated NlpC family hydrolase